MDPTVILTSVGDAFSKLAQLVVAFFGDVLTAVSPFDAFLAAISVLAAIFAAYAFCMAIRATSPKATQNQERLLQAGLGAAPEVQFGTVVVDIPETTERPFCPHCGGERVLA